MKRIRVALVLGGLLLAGCSSHDPAGGAATSAPAAASAPADQPLDLCQLMPVADVAAILQAHGADTVTEQKLGAGGMCSYLHVPKPGDYRTKLLIDFTRMPSADQARQGLAALRRDLGDRGIAVTPVPGLGDEAFLVKNEGAAGLDLRLGAYQGQVNLNVDDRDPASLYPAVQALGKQVLARLP